MTYNVGSSREITLNLGIAQNWQAKTNTSRRLKKKLIEDSIELSNYYCIGVLLLQFSVYLQYIYLYKMRQASKYFVKVQVSQIY